jgi:hypothetical protein
MADWLILLLKYGGFGAVLFLALFVLDLWGDSEPKTEVATA